MKQCKTNLSAVVNRNVLKLLLISFSKMLFVFIINSLFLLDPVLQCGESMSFQLCVVLEFLFEEWIPMLHIHGQLQHAY